MAFPLLALDAIAAIGGLIIPPAFDFIKKKFVKEENDTPERTMGTLATTKPEVLPDYVKAIAGLREAEVKFFNRDVIGEPHQWVVSLRAVIRPIAVCTGLFFMLLDIIGTMNMPGLEGATIFKLDQGTKMFFEAIIASWFGTKIVQRL